MSGRNKNVVPDWQESSETVLISENEQIDSSEEETSKETPNHPSSEDKSEQELEEECSEETTEMPLEDGELASLPGGYIKSDGSKTPDGYPAIERDGEPIYIDVVNTWRDKYFGHPDANPSAHVDEFITLAQQIENDTGNYMIYSTVVKDAHIIFTGEHNGHLCFLVDGAAGFCIDESNGRIYTEEIFNPHGDGQKEFENRLSYLDD